MDLSAGLSGPAVVTVSPLITAAVNNVVENAVEHTDNPVATVTVGLRVTEDAVVFAVADDGPGIPPNELEIIESGSETPLQHSSGLGLWLVHSIVTESGGRVEHDENEPTGSIVRFVFPRHEPDVVFS
jgi:signal transduction histidine kinase